jgi:ferredoxin-NADP reductase
MGLADAMAWPLRASHFVELINPLWSSHALRARVEKVEDETTDARTLTLRPGRGFRRHRAGQFVRVSVSAGGMQQTRTYSISSAPERDDGCFTITVKAQGRVSKHLVRETRAGDHVSIGQPEGEFVLPESAPVKPLFITAGSGITPVMSMLRSLATLDGKGGRLSGVVHLHYAPHGRDVIFGEELRELAARHAGYRLSLVLTGEARNSHFSQAQLLELCPDFREREVYACGPFGLLEDVERVFDGAGLGGRVHVERFAAKISTPPGEISGGRVRFSRSKAEADSDGVTNLLRLAENAGLNPRHGCRMGICHECVVTLKSGCVRDLRTNELLNEPGSRVQPCVCAAAGDAELDI